MGFKNLNNQLKENRNVEALANAENFIESARGETEVAKNKKTNNVSQSQIERLKREKKVLIYLTDEEFELINQMISKLGMNKASLIRFCIMEKARELGFIDGFNQQQ